ncbi:MAG: diguanylate cyclase [Deltaproteobacteria bacterium]|nr:diguanylate cyclase [Deltaproteobacteria bacterium]
MEKKPESKESNSRFAPFPQSEPLPPQAAPGADGEDALGVLVVEDNSDIREMVTLLVSSMGYHTYSAATGKEALEQLRLYTPDIVLLDLMMPEMDGFEFCRAVQADPALTTPHIIITSAKDALEDKVKGLELGAADYLTKPFDFTELKARIRAGERIVRYQKMLKEQQVLLEQLAREDKLTGLCNRRHFEERAHEECLRAQRYERPLSLLLGDLDDFKQVNDRYGHACGDMVLRQVGQTLLLHCRSSDLVARYGGEEFAVLLFETEAEHAQKVAERLCAAIRTLSFSHPSGPFHITISFGVASLLLQRKQDLTTLLEEADKALYAAKHKGRNRVERGLDEPSPETTPAVPAEKT